MGLEPMKFIKLSYFQDNHLNHSVKSLLYKILIYRSIEQEYPDLNREQEV